MWAVEEASRTQGPEQGVRGEGREEGAKGQNRQAVRVLAWSLNFLLSVTLGQRHTQAQSHDPASCDRPGV